MRKTAARLLTIMALVAGVVIAGNSPASAVIVMSGDSFSCMPGHPVTFHAHGSGTIKYYYPSNGMAKSTSGPFSGIVYSTHTSRLYTVTSWKITATGFLDAQDSGIGCAA